MNRKSMVALSVVLSSLALVFSAQSQAQERAIGRILTYSDTVWVNGKLVRKEDVGKWELRVDDFIQMGSRSSVKVEIRLEPDRKVTLDLRTRSRLRILTAEQLTLIAELQEGDLRIETRGEGVRCKVNTSDGNAGSSGTEFRVITRDAGTIVNVLGGQVEFRRRDEVIPIIQGYKAAVSTKDQSLRVISNRFVHDPRPHSKQLLLSAVLPFTGRDMNRTRTVLTQILSIGSAIGFFVSGALREDASNTSDRAYSDYRHEFEPYKIKQFYDRHLHNEDKADKYYKIQIGCAALYGVLLGYETWSTIRDARAYRKIVEEIRELEEELRGPKVGLEIRGNGILAKASWSFE
jgi:hypothetical protein